MILLLSPSKTLDFSDPEAEEYSQPRKLEKSSELIGLLRKKSHKGLRELMDISDGLASLNAERYADFETPFNLDNAKQALWAFQGDVYSGLRAEEFSEEEVHFAQSHLRILSGLYALLRPLDLMQPYRLEMGTQLKNKRGKNLYEFWGEDITEMVNEDLAQAKGNAVINLASQEYFKAIDTSRLKGELYDIHFKEKRADGSYRVIAVYAKKARGAMAHFAVKNRITNPEGLKGFDWEGYAFNESLSSEQEFTFTR